jgi:dTDP-glucose 4,6-dehydratase
MRAVVTGGAGFLGSHLCEALLTRGDAVVCLDNLSTGSVRNIKNLMHLPNFDLVEGDITTGIAIPGPIDVVAHLASPASPRDYLRHPLETLAAGSRGTENALRLAQATGARFLLASTSEVYGDPTVHPQPEHYWGNVNSIGPRSVYDEAKRYAEAVTMAYARALSINVGIVRIFNTYGPRMRPQDGRVITTFIAQALNGDPLTIYGDGSQTRSYCYVDDLIRGLVSMIDSTETGPINLGTQYELSVLDLASLVLKITGSKSVLEYHPLPTDDPSRRRPVLRRAEERLGWRPQISMEDGLRRMVQWFQTCREEVAAAKSAISGGPLDEISGTMVPSPLRSTRQPVSESPAASSAAI